MRAKDFIWWSGAGARRAKAALAAHDTEELDGGLLIRIEDRKPFEAAKPRKGAVDLLPKWDCYQMGYAPDGRDRFAHADVVKQCYDFRGDGRPVILVDGEAAGTWERLEVDLFEKATPKVRKAIDARIDAVKAFLELAHRSIASAARTRPSCAAIQRATPAARVCSSGRASARPTASCTPRGVQSRRGSRTPRPAQSTRAAFSAMSPPGRADHHRAAAGERAHQRPVAAVGHDQVARRHRLRVRQPRHQHGVLGTETGGSGSRPLQRRDHAYALVGEPRQGGPQEPVLRVLRRRRGDEHHRAVAGRRVDRARQAAPTAGARPRAATPASRAGTRAAAASRPA